MGRSTFDLHGGRQAGDVIGFTLSTVDVAVSS
jgi:hypothetical protein